GSGRARLAARVWASAASKLFAGNAVATAQNQNGYWRIGGDNVSGWPSAPTSNYFAGGLDEAAVYASELTAAQIAAHYNAAA
ncbi:MAG: hypothetical protein JWO57_2729, partial [Pseudonocardiales bacterium]|nr:hypothetical protein [Pseudonocardiales bacterium]